MSARFKDANECLQAGLTPEAMAEAVRSAEVIKPSQLKGPLDMADQIYEKVHPKGTDGLPLPWGNRNGSSLPFRFRKGEVTVWSGYNKHGKSEVLNHVIVDLCWQGERAMIASLEVQGPQTFQKLLRMVHCRREVSEPGDRDGFVNALSALDGRIWVYDHVGSAPLADVLNVMLYAYQRYGVTQFVLDSLMRFDGLDGEGQNIWNNQRDFMDQLIKFAQTYLVHIHLVAHSKKPERGGENKIPRRYDIMGSSYIPNLAFNVIVVWRNREKQDQLQEVWQQCEARYAEINPKGYLPWKRLAGRPPDAGNETLRKIHREMLDVVQQIPKQYQDMYLENIEKHDAYLIVDAQRGGDGDCPARYLWFDYESLQFLEACPTGTKVNRPGSTPRPYYLEQPVYEEEL